MGILAADQPHPEQRQLFLPQQLSPVQLHEFALLCSAGHRKESPDLPQRSPGGPQEMLSKQQLVFHCATPFPVWVGVKRLAYIGSALETSSTLREVKGMSDLAKSSAWKSNQCSSSTKANFTNRWDQLPPAQPGPPAVQMVITGSRKAGEGGRHYGNEVLGDKGELGPAVDRCSREGTPQQGVHAKAVSIGSNGSELTRGSSEEQPSRNKSPASILREWFAARFILRNLQSKCFIVPKSKMADIVLGSNKRHCTLLNSQFAHGCCSPSSPPLPPFNMCVL